MTRFRAGLLLACATLAPLAGCVRRVREPVAPEPFVFRALDLRQQTGQGQPAWDLTSPEARYDLTRQLAQTRQPRGSIYRRGKRYLTISAQRGTVIGDGQAIQLEGAVQITLLGANPIRITGDQARWLPRQDLMVIDRRPVAIDRRSRISGRVARYRVAEDLVELRGTPLLEQWPRQQVVRTAQEPATIRVRAASIDWKPDRGDLIAKGPVLGERFKVSTSDRSERPSKGADLVLTSSGLRGNLREGFIDLLEPVRMRDSNVSRWLHARQTRWAINDEWLASDQPFQGAINALQVRGNGLRINLADESVLVPSACSLEQPGEQLRADQCRWSWTSGRFEAQGSVVLRRQAYRQITRASQLQGQIGKDGTAIFTSPGARVNSQFNLPPKGARHSPQRQAASPVTF